MEEQKNQNSQTPKGVGVETEVIPPFKPYNLAIKLKWWQKIILWFKPAYIGMDIGKGDKAYYTIIKKLGDKTIVMKTGEAKAEFGVDKAV